MWLNYIRKLLLLKLVENTGAIKNEIYLTISELNSGFYSYQNVNKEVQENINSIFST